MKIRIILLIGVTLSVLLSSCGGGTAKPDLQALKVEKGSDLVKVTVKNNGSVDVGEFKFNVKLFKSGNIMADINKKVDGVRAGSEQVFETSLSQTEYDSGQMMVDSDQKIDESDETNNALSF